MLLHVITCIVLIFTCLGSQIPNLVQDLLLPKDVSLNELSVSNVQEIYKDFINGTSKKPEEYTKIIDLLEGLVKTANRNIQGLNSKVLTTLQALKIASAASAAAITKVKVDEGKKVASAQQAHNDAKAARDKQKPGFDHEIATLTLVIRMLWPHSSRQLIANWEHCQSRANCSSWGEVCMGYRNHYPWSDLKHLQPEKKYTIKLGFIPIYSWDNEVASVSVNGKVCWTKKFFYNQIKTGANCGKHSHGYAKLYPVTCEGVADKAGVIKIRSQAVLNSIQADESYGVTAIQVKAKA